MVKKVFEKIEIVIDSLHLVKNLFENVREFVLQFLRNKQCGACADEIIEKEKENLNGGDIGKLKKVRYYRSVLSCVDVVYIVPLQKLIENLRENQPQLKQQIEDLISIMNSIAEIVFVMYKRIFVKKTFYGFG